MKKRIIRDGMQAWYNISKPPQLVVLCNVKSNKGTYEFNAKDKNTNQLLRRRDGIILSWADFAFDRGTFDLIDPEYEDIPTPNSDETTDDLSEQRNELRKFFEKHIKYDCKPFILDNEQLNAVLSKQNTIVTARAGSGKTRVLIAKLLYLFEKQQLDDSNVLAFCFNKDASIEISDRLHNKCLVDGNQKFQKYDVAKTFHSFAKSTIDKSNKILTDKTKLIKIIINDFRKSDYSFSKLVYSFFRKDTLRIDRKSFSSTQAYYDYIKNSEYTTLNGEKVKSKGEKYIADYLFEHGINYVYEKSFYPYKLTLDTSDLTDDEKKRCLNFIGERKETIPDFYLNDYDLIWEHWGLTGDETPAEKIKFEKTVGNYQEYIENRTWKKKFWSNWRNRLSAENKYNKQIISIKGLIETDIKQFKLPTRESIENLIESVLGKYNIKSKKLPEKVLIEKVWEKCIDGFTVLIEQLINKLQQNYFDCIDKFETSIDNVSDEKTHIFYRLGYKIYRKYIDILQSSNNSGIYSLYNDYSYDFNQIIYECSKLINNGYLDKKIALLKWILIDEYQDFSRLFDFLIKSILSRNEDIKVFCVGDDWQAINRFAGSDLKYYREFLLNYPDAKTLNIRTNYRSENHIVQYANKFMDRCDMPGTRPISYIPSSGLSTEIDISTVYLGKIDSDNIYVNAVEQEEYNKFEKAKYIKSCADIIKRYKNKKIMILSRSNSILGMELDDFNITLKTVCLEFMNREEYLKNVIIKTVHKSKGEEADIVIILNVNKGIFPVFNPNNDLFVLFEQTSIQAVEDEARLYYVALTRAKHSLYILYEDSKKSPYIMS